MRNPNTLAALVFFVVSVCPFAAADLYVDDDAPNDPGPMDMTVGDLGENGASEHPFDSIQEAIAAAHAGDIVVVRPGVYRERLDLLGKGITVVGSWLVETNGTADLPTVDGGGTGPVVTFASREDPNCVFEGLRIRGGRAMSGAAILCRDSSPRIRHCLICGNIAPASQGSVIECRNSNASFVNCTVSGNIVPAQAALLRCTESTVGADSSIFWQNFTAPGEVSAVAQAVVVRSGSGPAISYSDIQGGWLAPGNMDLDPMFIVAGAWVPTGTAEAPTLSWMDGDYHLQTGSPGIDAGDPTADPNREPSPNGGRIDAGVYGGTGQASRSYSTPPVPQSTAESEAGRLLQRVYGGGMTAEAGTAILVHDPSGTPLYYLVPGTASSTGTVGMLCGIDAHKGVWEWRTTEPPGAGPFPPVSAQQAAERVALLLHEHATYGRTESPICVTLPNKQLYWQFCVQDSDRVGLVFVCLFNETEVYDPTNTLSNLDFSELQLDAAASCPVQLSRAAQHDETAAPRSLPDIAAAQGFPPQLSTRQLPDACDLGLPFVRTGEDDDFQRTGCWCSEAALHLVFDYYGPAVSQNLIALVAKPVCPEGTWDNDLRRAMYFSDMTTLIGGDGANLGQGYPGRPIGYACWWRYSSGSWRSELKQAIANGHPVIVGQYYDGSHKSTHSRVVTAYNDNGGWAEILVLDPAYTGAIRGPTWFTYSHFEDVWGVWHGDGNRYYYGCVPMPWRVTLSAPAKVCPNSTFTVEATAEYNSPTGTSNGWTVLGATGSTMKITLPAGYSLAKGQTAIRAAAGIVDNGIQEMSWECVSPSISATGKIVVDANAIVAGDASDTVRAGAFKDRIGGMAEATISTSQAPVLSKIGNRSVMETMPLSFPVNGTDPDGDRLTYFATNLPAGATFNGKTFSWTPSRGQAGEYQVTFSVSDGGCDMSETITITVARFNRAPELDRTSLHQAVKATVVAGTLLGFTVSATDPDGDPLTYSASGLPGGAAFSWQTFAWTPLPDQDGEYWVTFSANDGQATDSETVLITVKRLPVADTLHATDITTTSATLNGVMNDDGGEECQYQFRYSESRDPFDYTYTDYIGRIKGQGGFFSVTVTDLRPGSRYWFAARVKNSAGESSWPEQDRSFTTLAVNRPPTLAPIGNRSATAGIGLTFSVDGTDPDGDSLTYSASPLPQGAAFTGQTFTWTPATGQAGGHSITFSVSDGKASDSETVIITVTSSIRLPVVVTEPATAITPTTATLHGRVLDDGGEACQCRFRYKKASTDTYHYTPYVGLTRTGQAFSANLANLDPGAAYDFAAQARNSSPGGSETDWPDHDQRFTTTTEEQPVYFADPALKAAVEEALGKTNPTPTDMQGLTELHAWARGLSDLTGLKYATNLRILDLYANSISDISELSGLTNLEVLGVIGGGISDISAVSGLTKLWELDLDGNQVTDISPVSHLTNLMELIVNANRIESISALSGLTKLRLFEAGWNQISDISVLSGHRDLVALRLQYNSIADISSLDQLSELVYLRLDSNPLQRDAFCTHLGLITANNPGVDLQFSPNSNQPGDVSASTGTYAGKVRITWDALCPGPGSTQTFNYRVYRADSPIGTKVVLGGWTAATSLDDTSAAPGVHYSYWVESDNAAGQLAGPVQGWTTEDQPVHFADPALKAAVEEALGKTSPTPADMLGLWDLLATDKNIKDLTGLEYASNITQLCLHDNQIADLSPLSGLTKLTWLGLANNRISSISPLSGLTNLTDLWLPSNQISVISPLSGLTSLRGLYLYGNGGISNISALSGLTELTTLYLYGNQITDISALNTLTKLSALNLSSNRIADLSVVLGLTNLAILYLHENRIEHIPDLAGLVNLHELGLRSNQISNISGLLALRNLRYLGLAYNPLDQVSLTEYIPEIEANNPGIAMDY